MFLDESCTIQVSILYPIILRLISGIFFLFSLIAKYQLCSKTLAYHYNIDSCQATCRSLSEPDVTCSIKFTPVDGCTCEKGTYLDETGKCVPATSCPCYYKGSPLPSGEVVHENGIIW